MKIKFLLYSILAITLFSCQSTPKDIAYFQDIEKYAKQGLGQDQQGQDPIVKIGDQLLITVSAPVLFQERVAQFNLPVNSYFSESDGETIVNYTNNLQTYTVDENGYINFPILGQLKMAGLTKSVAKNQISGLVAAHVEEAIVNFQIVSFQVTVLGEVNKPGPVPARNSRLTILEAIGATGDLTIYGNRKNVLLIRETDGVKQHAHLDLTKAELISSPYYYLQQNDVIIVDPNDTKKRTSNFGAAENYQISILSLAFTAVSVVISCVSILSR